jgi:hypothetical protein
MGTRRSPRRAADPFRKWGYEVEKKVEIYDMHASLLQLLGVDLKRLIVRFGGRDRTASQRAWYDR